MNLKSKVVNDFVLNGNMYSEKPYTAIQLVNQLDELGFQFYGLIAEEPYQEDIYRNLKLNKQDILKDIQNDTISEENINLIRELYAAISEKNLDTDDKH